MSEPTEVKALAPKLHAGSLKQKDSAIRELVAEIRPETPKEAVLASSFWTHHARALQSRDEILCLRDDLAWQVTLRVIYVNGPEVMVKPVTPFIDLDAEDMPKSASGGFGTKWRGPHAKWSVIRLSDGVVIKDCFGSNAEAQKFMVSLVRAAAA